MFKLGITGPARAFDCSTVEGIERAAAAGVDGVEFFDFDDKNVDAIVKAGEKHGIEVFGTSAAGYGENTGNPDEPAMVRPEHHDTAVTDIERSIEVVEEFNGSTVLVTVGPDQPDLGRTTQQNAVVRVLRTIAHVAEDAGVTVVIEPLNNRIDHPGYFLTTTAQGVELIEAVNSPNVKLLYDIYHQQITEGDIIRRFRRHFQHIGHIHIADNPGRHEPGTGELDYETIFTAIAESGYDGYVSCEFSSLGEPDGVYRDIVALADRARE